MSRIWPAALLAALLVLAQPAHGDYDPLGSGATRVQLDKGFLAFLKKHGVTLGAKAPARRRGRTIVLPVAGGEMDPTIGKGTIEHDGAIFLRRGKRRLPFRQLTLKVKRTPFIAKVGGSQLKVANAKGIGTRRTGFGTSFSARGLRLTAKVVPRLNKKLGLRKVFTPGQPLATIQTRAEPRTVTVLPRGRAILAMDPGFVAKMDSLFVSINPIFPTELAPGSVLSVPITLGGSLAPDASIGRLRTLGAIEFLQQGAGQVFFDEFWFEMGPRVALSAIEIRPTPTFRGKLGQLPTFAFGGAAISSNPRGRTVGVAGASLALGAETAAAFNEGFAEGKPSFAAGEPFGILTFTAKTQ